MSGLLILSLFTLTTHVILNGIKYGTATSGSVAFIGYIALRVFSRFAKTGWEEYPLFRLESLSRKKQVRPEGKLKGAELEISAPDTLDPSDLIRNKVEAEERIRSLRPNQELRLVADLNGSGLCIHEIESPFPPCDWKEGGYEHAYSLYQLTTVTDPLTVFSLLAGIKSPLRILIRIQGKDSNQVKRQIELSRRRSLQSGQQLTDVDSEVTFEESSKVLTGISRGDESVVEMSWVILSKSLLDIDTDLFVREKHPDLAISSASGYRLRTHRSHWVRSVTASDFIPTVFDPSESGFSILKTRRELPLYFSPDDSRLEALHWLVVGASGSGKSFFTGLVLKRMIDHGAKMSVVFVDHNRSFRRLVRSVDGTYLEPTRIDQLEKGTAELFDDWNRPGSITGIELSDLDIQDKKIAAHTVLSRIETFLRFRDTTHPVYLVLDECWNLMRDEPLLVQRAFREFRKLNGAVIAITQSLSDFLSDQSGQSICQNAPVRILLRQGEDISRYQGILGLNAIESDQVRHLRQKRKSYSECLIKTPFLSRIGRLYPTPEEYAILRTDNIREELIRATKRKDEECAISI